MRSGLVLAQPAVGALVDGRLDPGHEDEAVRIHGDTDNAVILVRRSVIPLRPAGVACGRILPEPAVGGVVRDRLTAGHDHLAVLVAGDAGPEVVLVRRIVVALGP